ncbi:T9SS C-terminal target domain-containing protein [Marinilabiliaceae bacterium JC017]|nr:T9SS C-terminal target domain-containing protein [Marinilabiliaceae bacterium JC017]
MKTTLQAILILMCSFTSFAQPSKGIFTPGDWSSDINFTSEMAAQWSGATEFTIEFWMKRTNSGASRNIINVGWNAGANQGFGMQIGASNNMSMMIGNYIVWTPNETLNNPETPDWEHIAFVYDGSAQKVSFYKNGLFISSNNLSNPAPTEVASSFAGVFRISQGDIEVEIADVRIWKKALSESTIANYYQHYVPANHPNINSLVNNWRMDAINASDKNKIIDSGKAGIHGTMTDGCSWFGIATGIFNQPVSSKATIIYQPSSREIIIKNYDLKGKGDLTVYDISGRLVQKIPVEYNGSAIILPMFHTKGLYVVELKANNKKATKKIALN